MAESITQELVDAFGGGLLIAHARLVLLNFGLSNFDEPP